MQSRVNVKLTFDVTTPEGKAFHKTVLDYSDLPYPMLLQIENACLDALKALNVVAAKEIEAAAASGNKWWEKKSG